MWSVVSGTGVDVWLLGCMVAGWSVWACRRRKGASNDKPANGLAWSCRWRDDGKLPDSDCRYQEGEFEQTDARYKTALHSCHRSVQGYLAGLGGIRTGTEMTRWGEEGIVRDKLLRLLRLLTDRQTD